MPYTIKPLDRRYNTAYLVARLVTAVREDGRFDATFDSHEDRIEVPRVRLVKAKEYCGNHPGPCDAFGARRKMKARYLEWDDWVVFHNVVNDVLDHLLVDADVWSRPQDARGKFFMRRGHVRRLHYDYHEKPSRLAPGRTVRVWNLGTPDQFKERP